MNRGTGRHAPQPDASDDAEQVLLDEARRTNDLDKLRDWAASTYNPLVLAVLENPFADASVLDRVADGHEVIDLVRLAHSQCPPRIIDQLATSSWPDVRARAREVAQSRAKQKATLFEVVSRRPSKPVGKTLAQAEERRRTPISDGPWSATPYTAEGNADWMNEDEVRPYREEDMPAAIYVPTYEDAFFDLGDTGTAAYTLADPVDDGPTPTYILERVVAGHPRTSRDLLERVAAKLVGSAELRATLQFERIRTRPDGTPQRLIDDLAPFLRVLTTLVKRLDLPKDYLARLMNAKIPEIRNLVALSPNAHKNDLKQLASSVTALPYLAAHPSKKVREFQEMLLGQPHSAPSGRRSYAGVRGLLAASEYITDAAFADILDSGSHEELLGLAANPKLDRKTFLFLAEDHHHPEVHQALASNEKAPDEVLEVWANHEDLRMRAIVARNPGTPQDALLARVSLETVPGIRDALASNPRLPTKALDTFLGQGYLTGLASNPRLPLAIQEHIADSSNTQARYHLALNRKTAPHVLGSLVAKRPSPMHIELAVSAHSCAPVEALQYLKTSSDTQTSIAARVALHSVST